MLLFHVYLPLWLLYLWLGSCHSHTLESEVLDDLEKIWADEHKPTVKTQSRSDSLDCTIHVDSVPLSNSPCPFRHSKQSESHVESATSTVLSSPVAVKPVKDPTFPEPQISEQYSSQVSTSSSFEPSSPTLAPASSLKISSTRFESRPKSKIGGVELFWILFGIVLFFLIVLVSVSLYWFYGPKDN